ncbi:MAG TPA: methyl-accepting chemotaxis protein [Candidatus Sulfotelmatobacter sp.]|nr:methyl-accepting chemotaxis protein [Candidatus Sulfotelmatobacter sp.]
MFGNRRHAVEPVIVSNDSFAAEREAAILAALDLIEAGKFLSVPQGDCTVTRRLFSLARRLHDGALGETKRIVGVSIEVNEAICHIAEMIREASEVGNRAQTIAASTEELTTSVAEISKNSQATAEEAFAAQEVAHRGQIAADQAVASMEEIAHAVHSTAERVDSLNAASAQIGGIIDQIQAIAKQTNLLALNATIEAARAGEAGKGFAVVASEVKNLANQTAKATEVIRERIETLRAEMAAIVSSMQEGADAVQKGREVIATAGDGMREVSDQINAMTGRVRDISAILTQQSGASQHIAEAIQVIADMADRNAANITDSIGLLEKVDPIVAECVAEKAQQEILNFTVVVAQSDHMIWRKKLSSMLVGLAKLNPNELADHHKCRLGKWYDAVQDASLRSDPTFVHLESPHQDVHAHGIEAARRYNDGDLHGAVDEAQMAAKASVGVLEDLRKLAARR